MDPTESLTTTLTAAGIPATVQKRGEQTWLVIRRPRGFGDALAAELTTALAGVATLAGPVYDHHAFYDVRVEPLPPPPEPEPTP